MNDENHDDDNPWDEDDGARTLATAGPSFELPSNIPSPITVPPPPVAMPKHAAKSTLVGLMPDDVRASLANRVPARPGEAPRSQLQRVTIPDDALDDLPGQKDFGPTIMGASASPNVPLCDDLAPPKSFAQPHRFDDADAETMALSIEDACLPNLDRAPVPDEATRALTREHMPGPGAVRQDAHVIVGSDARGDEATLAIGPEQTSPDFGEFGASLDPALAEALAQRVAEHHQQAYQKQYQQQGHQPPSPGPHFPQLQTQQQFAAPQPPQFAQPASYATPQAPGYPGCGQHPAAYPSSDQHPAAPPPSPWGAPQPAPWTQLPAPLARAEAGSLSVGGFRITSQIIIIAGVGVVCLSIFVVGLVLFFTTKF